MTESRARAYVTSVIGLWPLATFKVAEVAEKQFFLSQNLITYPMVVVRSRYDQYYRRYGRFV